MKSILLVLIVSLFSVNALALNCHGTEPFWSAEVSDEKVDFLDFDDKVQSTRITEVKAASGFTSSFMQIYVNARGPVAVVTSNTCSDSMSDFAFPKEIILFTDMGVRYGCCGEGVLPEGGSY